MLRSITTLNKTPVKTEAKCTICLETTANESLAHINNKEEIQHVVSCSLKCFENYCKSLRSDKKKILCPICRTEVKYINDTTIASLEKIQEIQSEITTDILTNNFTEIQPKIQELQKQYITEYLAIDLAAPLAFMQDNKSAIDYILTYMQGHPNELDQTKPQTHQNQQAKELDKHLFLAMLATIYSSSDETIKHIWNVSLKQNSSWLELQNKPSSEKISYLEHHIDSALTNILILQNKTSESPQSAKIFKYLLMQLNPSILKEINFSEIATIILKDYQIFQNPQADLLEFLSTYKDKFNRLSITLSQNSTNPNDIISCSYFDLIFQIAIKKADLITLEYLLQNINYSNRFLSTLTLISPEVSTQEFPSFATDENIDDLKTKIEQLISKRILQNNIKAIKTIITIVFPIAALQCFIIGKVLYKKIKGS